MRKDIVLRDLLHPEIIFQGSADIDTTGKNGISIVMDTPEYKESWKLYKEGCILSRSGEAQVQAILKKEKSSKILVHTVYGKLEIGAELLFYQYNEQFAEVHYKLNESQEHFHFKLEIQPETGKTEKEDYKEATFFGHYR